MSILLAIIAVAIGVTLIPEFFRPFLDNGRNAS